MRVVREMYETSNRGDFERALEYFSPDVELIVPDTLPDPGLYRGRDALSGYFANWYVTLFESWRVEALDTTQFGSAVVTEHRLRGKGRTSSIEITMDSASVNVVRDGVIVKSSPQASLADAVAVAQREAERDT
jgi:ketosteroid isomerase-like protein